MRARRHSIQALLVLLALSGFVLAAGDPAGASTAAASRASGATPSAVAAIAAQWSSVPEYSSSPVIDRGTVVNSGGRPVPGATVLLFPVLLGAPAGTALTPLARAMTDSSGHYAIHLPAARDSRLAKSRSGGALNLHLMAFYPGGQANWFSPIPAGTPRVAPAATLTLHATASTAGRAATPRASPSPSRAKLYLGLSIGLIALVALGLYLGRTLSARARADG